MHAQLTDLPLTEIINLCRRYKVRELAVFGSYVNGDYRMDSDIDFLVEFVSSAAVGFLTFARMRRELEELLHKPVDLVPKSGLKQRIRRQVLDSRQVLYAA